MVTGMNFSLLTSPDKKELAQPRANSFSYPSLQHINSLQNIHLSNSSITIYIVTFYQIFKSVYLLYFLRDTIKPILLLFSS